MSNECKCNVLEYKKAIPTEEIHIGDIIMMDTASGLITRAVINTFPEPIINDSLVLGVCIGSWLDGPVRVLLDGGKAKDEERITVNGGEAPAVQTIILLGGAAKDPETPEVIQVAYEGAQTVNIEGKSKIGDKLIISKTPGKATPQRLFRDPDLYVRTLGKIIQYIDDTKEQATVLLDIE